MSRKPSPPPAVSRGPSPPPPLSRPVFDDILGEVHGADFPQSRSKTNYNQNKHGVEHLDNAVTSGGDGDHKDAASGGDTAAGDNTAADSGGAEIDHTAQQPLPTSFQYPPPQRTEETTTTTIRSTTTATTATTNKPSAQKGYLPSKKKGYLPSKKKGYLPSKKKGY